VIDVKLYTHKEFKTMLKNSGVTEVDFPISLTAGYSKEEMQKKISLVQSKIKTLELDHIITIYDMLVSTRKMIWENLGATDELVSYRLEVFEEMFIEDYKMTMEQRREKYADKDTYRFEKRLAEDVIDKCGIDKEYQIAKREKERYEAMEEEFADLIEVPEERMIMNPILVTRLDIEGYIKGKVFLFFQGEDVYPDVLEEPVETLGV